MKQVNVKKQALILILGLLIAGNGILCAYSKNKNDEDEEKEFTEAHTIEPQKLNNVEGRTYDEGITIKEIEIKGNNLVNTDRILKQISMKQGSKFDKDQIQKDLKTIYDMGFFTEKIRAVPQSSSKGIKLRIEVEENTPVTGFNISGNTVISTEELGKIFKDQSGLPQNVAALNQNIQEIENIYSKKGFILARVKKISDDVDGMINIEINEGLIDEIKFSGNKKTKDFVIKRQLLTSPNTIYNEKLLTEDLRRLMSSQAFSDVRRVITASPNNPEKYNLTIEVDEKRTGAISLGGAVDTGAGLMGSVGYLDNNFRGLGQNLSLTVGVGSGVVLKESDVVNRANFQCELNFVEPRFRQTLNSLNYSAFAREFASYQVPLGVERRFGTEFEISRPIKRVPNLAGSMNIGLEKIDVREGDAGETAAIFAREGIDISERAKQLEGGTYISMGPTLIYDSRDSFVNPRNGWYVSGSLSESFMISGEAGTFGKVSTVVRRFYPIGEKSTVLVGGKLASKVVGDLPEFASFRLGGSNTIRGFREGDVGNGNGFMMATAEYRTPIPYLERLTKINFFNDMRMAFFFDAGTVFKETVTNKLFNRPGYGITMGTGLLVNIPGMGKIRVDYGYPLTSVGAGNKRTGRFTFGFGEKY